MPEHHHDAVVGDMNDESREGACPVAHARAPHPTQNGGNAGWWPARLNLKILAKNPAVASQDQQPGVHLC